MTIDFIPPAYYSFIFFNLMWLFVFACAVLVNSGPLHLLRYDGKLKIFGYSTLLFTILSIGLRPLSGFFVDMMTYAAKFNRVAIDPKLTISKDWLYDSINYFSSQIMDVHTFFLLCSLLYIAPLAWVARKNFGELWPIGFLAMVSFYGFWAYGVNGIRQGLASSWFLLAFCSLRLRYQIPYLFLATGFHAAYLLPAAALMAARFGPGVRACLLFWVLCIPLSLAGGSAWENFFASLGFEDDRIAYLTTEASEKQFSKIGFRWDFLVFSAVPVALGYYFVEVLKYSDKVYDWLFSTYLITNGFWILVIRANFSNRFAQLSWSLMGFLMIYPLLRQRLLPNQERYIGLGLIALYGMTYFLYVILKNID